MRTIIVNRDHNGKPNGMTSKQWDDRVRSLQTSAFKRTIRVNVNRSTRKAYKKRLARLEEKRQEAMRNWTKQP
jgi:hypothetical protein